MDDLDSLLVRAASGDLEAYGDFIAASAGKAGRLLAVMGCAGARYDEVLVACYREAWADRASYAGAGLSPLAWLLVRVHDAALRDAAA